MQKTQIPFAILRAWMRSFLHHRQEEQIKRLPLGEHEEEGTDTYWLPKTISCRFLIKIMFLGVVDRPVPQRDFDGKTLLEYINEQVPVSKLTSYQNFSDNLLINCAIKRRMENST